MDLSAKDLAPVVMDIIIQQVNWINGSGQTAKQLITDDGDLLADSLATYQCAAQVAHFFSLSDSMEPEDLLDRPNVEYWADLAAQRLADNEPTITFSSGGTSGKIKHITHSFEALVREANFWAKNYQQIEQCYRGVPSHHIYGFIWGLLLPKLLSIESTDTRHKLPNTVLNRIESALIITIPDTLSIWQMAGEVTPNKHIVVSTAPCQWDQLIKTHQAGFASVMQVYGSTETGAVGYRNISKSIPEHSNYELMPHLNYVENKVYDGDTELAIQDRLNFTSANHFSLDGRLDNLVQLRGRNINLDHLCQLLKSIKGVNDCTIRVDKTSNTSHLKCLIVCADDVRENSILAIIKKHPELAGLMNHVDFVKQLPRNAIGKLVDWTPENIN